MKSSRLSVDIQNDSLKRYLRRQSRKPCAVATTEETLKGGGGSRAPKRAWGATEEGSSKVRLKWHWSRNWTPTWRVTKGERLRRRWREGCQCQTCGGDAEPTRQGERVSSRGGLASRPSADARKTRRKRGRNEMASRSRFTRLRLPAVGSRWFKHGGMPAVGSKLT